jgi:hypothetical protein
MFIIILGFQPARGLEEPEAASCNIWEASGSEGHDGESLEVSGKRKKKEEIGIHECLEFWNWGK